MKIETLQKNGHIVPTAKVLVEAYFNSFEEARNRLRFKVKTKECLVAFRDNDVVGVLVYHRDYSHYANYIEDIAVSKKHRRRGVARGLLKKFIEISKKETPRNQKYALSSTRVKNKASIGMHLKCGFKEIGRLKGLHYGEDEIFFAYLLR